MSSVMSSRVEALTRDTSALVARFIESVTSRPPGRVTFLNCLRLMRSWLELHLLLTHYAKYSGFSTEQHDEFQQNSILASFPKIENAEKLSDALYSDYECTFTESERVRITVLVLFTGTMISVLNFVKLFCRSNFCSVV